MSRLHRLGDQRRRIALVCRPQLRVFKDYQNPFELYDDDSFRNWYRLSKPTAVFVIDMLRDDLQRATKRNHAIPVHVQVLTTLRFYAVGMFILLIYLFIELIFLVTMFATVCN